MSKFIVFCLFTIIAINVHSQKFRIVENSRLAKLVGRINGEKEKYAITIGKTIYISCSEKEFFARPWWMKHELTHILQYEKHGLIGFLQLYLFYSLRYGYADIPFEKTAIAAEFSKD